MLQGKPLAGPAEARHHFVEDQQNAELGRQLTHTLHVGRGRHQNAGGARQAFEQYGGDRAGTFALDHATQVTQCAFGLFGLGLRAEFAAVQVRREEVHVATGIFVRYPARITSGNDRRTSVAMVGAVSGQHLVASGEEPGHTHGVFVGISTTVGEEDFLETLRCLLDDALGGFAAGQVGSGWRDGGQGGGLLLNCRDHSRVLVPKVGVDQLAGKVQVALAIEVPDRAALPARDHQRVEQTLG
ncbi:hypothetical protein D3C79_734320 [compost metagenome]